ncbi:hypothetical protein PFISCL1PPCAC_24508, partial [Pristionchus fissidentatus]
IKIMIDSKLNKLSIRKVKKGEEEKENQDLFPILKLPVELSSKILSYLGNRELAVCLQSFTLDSLHAEWSNEKIIDYMELQMDGSKVRLVGGRYDNQSEFLDSSLPLICDRLQNVLYDYEFGTICISLLDHCTDSDLVTLIDLFKGIRCNSILNMHSGNQTYPKLLTDSSLRGLMENKKNVEIAMFCKGITADGLLAIWKDLLDGKFDCLTITVKKSVLIKLFDLIRTDGQKSSWSDHNMHPIVARGRKDSKERYEIRCGPLIGEKPFLRMHFVLLKKH